MKADPDFAMYFVQKAKALFTETFEGVQDFPKKADNHEWERKTSL